MNKIEKWYHDYIEDVDLNNIQWIKLNAEELKAFIDDNYLDKEKWEYVLDENHDMFNTILLGMTFLTLQSPLNDQHHAFLLGVVDNNIGKKTIVVATRYLDRFISFAGNQPLTYLSTVEVNSYFRNKGIYKKMCEVFSSMINPNQDILVTGPTEMGSNYNVISTLKGILDANGFAKTLYVYDGGLVHQNIHSKM